MKWSLVLAATVLGAYHFWWQLGYNFSDIFITHQNTCTTEMLNFRFPAMHIFKQNYKSAEFMTSFNTWCLDVCLRKWNKQALCILDCERGFHFWLDELFSPLMTLNSWQGSYASHSWQGNYPFYSWLNQLTVLWEGFVCSAFCPCFYTVQTYKPA